MWQTLCEAAAVPAEDVIEVRCGDKLLCVYNIEGTFYVTDGLCTHEPTRLAGGFVIGDIIECPMHNGLFHIPTGEAKGPPACVALKTYPARLENGQVQAQLFPKLPSG